LEGERFGLVISNQYASNQLKLSGLITATLITDYSGYGPKTWRSS